MKSPVAIQFFDMICLKSMAKVRCESAGMPRRAVRVSRMIHLLYCYCCFADQDFETTRSHVCPVCMASRMESHFDISVPKSLLLFVCCLVRQSVDDCRTHPSFNPLIYLLCIMCHTPYLFFSHGTVRTYVYIFLPSSLQHLLLSRPWGGKCRTN